MKLSHIFFTLSFVLAACGGTDMTPSKNTQDDCEVAGSVLLCDNGQNFSNEELPVPELSDENIEIKPGKRIDFETRDDLDPNVRDPGVDSYPAPSSTPFGVEIRPGSTLQKGGSSGLKAGEVFVIKNNGANTERFIPKWYPTCEEQSYLDTYTLLDQCIPMYEDGVFVGNAWGHCDYDVENGTIEFDRSGPNAWMAFTVPDDVVETEVMLELHDRASRFSCSSKSGQELFLTSGELVGSLVFDDKLDSCFVSEGPATLTVTFTRRWRAPICGLARSVEE